MGSILRDREVSVAFIDGARDGPRPLHVPGLDFPTLSGIDRVGEGPLDVGMRDDAQIKRDR